MFRQPFCQCPEESNLSLWQPAGSRTGAHFKDLANMEGKPLKALCKLGVSSLPLFSTGLVAHSLKSN